MRLEKRDKYYFKFLDFLTLKGRDNVFDDRNNGFGDHWYRYITDRWWSKNNYLATKKAIDSNDIDKFNLIPIYILKNLNIYMYMERFKCKEPSEYLYEEYLCKIADNYSKKKCNIF